MVAIPVSQQAFGSGPDEGVADMKVLILSLVLCSLLLGFFWFQTWSKLEKTSDELASLQAQLTARERELIAAEAQRRELDGRLLAAQAERERLLERVDVAYKVRLDLWLELERPVQVDHASVVGALELVTADGVLLTLMNHSLAGMIESHPHRGASVHFVFEPVDPGKVPIGAIRDLGQVVVIREGLRYLLERASVPSRHVRALVTLSVNDLVVFENQEIRAVSASEGLTEYSARELFVQVPDRYSRALRTRFE